MKTTRLLLILGLLALVLPELALAQAGTGSGGASGASIIGSVFETMLGRFGEVLGRNPLKNAGERLLSLLLVILISWKGIRVLLDSGSFSMAVAELVNVIVLVGVAKLFMRPDIHTQLVSGFDQVAMMAAQGTGAMLDVASPTAALTDSLGRLLNVAVSLFFGYPEGQDTTGVLSYLMQGISSLISLDLFATLANVLFRIVMAILVVIVAFIYMISVVWSQISINIALVVAPIFVPWLLWDSMAFLFHSWLKFVIVCGVQKIVGALMFGITAHMIESVAKVASLANAEPLENFHYYAATLLLVAIMAHMMAQVYPIANGLVSGMPSAGFKAAMNGMLNSSGARASGQISKAAGSTWAGAKAGTRAAVGAKNGFSAGKQSGNGTPYTLWRALSGAVQAAKNGGTGFIPKAPSSLPKSTGKTS